MISPCNLGWPDDIAEHERRQEALKRALESMDEIFGEVSPGQVAAAEEVWGDPPRSGT